MFIMDSPRPAENDSLTYKYSVSPGSYDVGDSYNKMVDPGLNNISVGLNDNERNNRFDARQPITNSTSDFKTKFNLRILQNEYNNLNFVDQRHQIKFR